MSPPPGWPEQGLVLSGQSPGSEAHLVVDGSPLERCSRTASSTRADPGNFHGHPGCGQGHADRGRCEPQVSLPLTRLCRSYACVPWLPGIPRGQSGSMIHPRLCPGTFHWAQI